ncbi:ESX secretion-associated protein EspG [Nocardia arizonensis]|uniref:ESX secretion-associated protein EspG n=1 Tax=Nocardia arizonensis TaxID=1141647 RepID=UPI0006D06028|nr:ESX secretion-associated protein EspG [Nocardia arizonensis]
MTEWLWEPDDFAALWYGDAHDRFPGPLRYTSRFAYRDEFRAHRAAVRARYDADELEEIRLALHTLGTSEVRIEILGGTCRHKRSTGREDLREYRIIGARNTFHAVTLMQSGTEHDHGPIRVRLSRPEHLPARVAADIPPCAPGSAAPEIFHPADLDPPRDRYLRDNARNTPRERYRRLLGGPADGGGTAVLLTGPTHNASAPVEVAQWHDITDDGRYTELRTTHIAVRPTTFAELSALFTGWLDRAWQRLSEADAGTW